MPGIREKIVLRSFTMSRGDVAESLAVTWCSEADCSLIDHRPHGPKWHAASIHRLLPGTFASRAIMRLLPSLASCRRFVMALASAGPPMVAILESETVRPTPSADRCVCSSGGFGVRFFPPDRFCRRRPRRRV